MAICRCLDQNHSPPRRGGCTAGYARPVKYPNTSSICGRKGCNRPAVVWLDRLEISQYQGGRRIFALDTDKVKVQVDDSGIHQLGLMKVSASKGATYGIRVGKADVSKYFPRSWKGKDLRININGTYHRFNLSNTFWTSCPEIRGQPIGRWLSRNRHGSWPKGHPPKFTLIPLCGNRFRLV